MIFEGPGPSPQKDHPKTSNKSPPGGQHDPQERPRRARERPKRSQDGPKSAPREPQEPPRGGLRAAWVAFWGAVGAQEAPGGLQEAIWAPSGVDFGLSGASFSKLPAHLAEPSGEQAQTQAQAQARAQAQEQAQAQEPKAKDRKSPGRKASRTQRPGGMCGAP